MKKLVSIPALRREMAELRRDIGAERATAEALRESGCPGMAEWHIRRIAVMENGLKWREAAISRERINRKEGRHGETGL